MTGPSTAKAQPTTANGLWLSEKIPGTSICHVAGRQRWSPGAGLREVSILGGQSARGMPSLLSRDLVRMEQSRALEGSSFAADPQGTQGRGTRQSPGGALPRKPRPLEVPDGARRRASYRVNPRGSRCGRKVSVHRCRTRVMRRNGLRPVWTLWLRRRPRRVAVSHPAS